MPKWIALVFLNLLGGLFICMPMSASSKVSFQDFWKEFRAAAIQEDKEKIIKLTHFPFNTRGLLDEDPTVKHDRSWFLKAYGDLFNADPGVNPIPSTMRAFLKENPEVPSGNLPTGDWARVGDFEFKIINGQWLFVLAYLPPLESDQQLNLPPELIRFWVSFQNAVKKHDIDKVVKLSKFPIASNDFGGPITSAEVLKKRYSEIFTPQVEADFERQQPKEVTGYPGYSVWGDDRLNFGFTKHGNEYRFTYIDNVNGE